MHTVARALARVNHRLKRMEQFHMLAVSLVVGVIGGYGAIAFRWLIQSTEGLVWSREALDSGTPSSETEQCMNSP